MTEHADTEALVASAGLRIERAAERARGEVDPAAARAMLRALTVECAGLLESADLEGLIAAARACDLDRLEPEVFTAVLALHADRESRRRARRDALHAQSVEQLRVSAFRAAARREQEQPPRPPVEPRESWLEIHRDEDGAMTSIVKHAGPREPVVDFDAELGRLLARVEGADDGEE